MPRAAKSSTSKLPTQTLVVDNGAHSIKAGFVTDPVETSNCRLIPNCVARDNDRRVWVGAQLDNCRDFASMAFRRPVEKGFLIRWEIEKAIWDNAFLEKGAELQCDPHDTNLVLAEAPNAPAALQRNCDEMVFEEYEFASYSRHVGPALNAYSDVQKLFGSPPRASSDPLAPAEAILVIDSGYSHTTITPVYKGRPIQQAIRRLTIGGKLLTNYLKELVSTSFNMSDEFYMMNQAKEQVCFVSQDFRADMDRAWKGDSTHPNMALNATEGLFVDYVLPDYTSRHEGIVRPHDPVIATKASKAQAVGGPREQVEPFLTLGSQRIKVPELLFNPGDIGMKEGGIPEVVMQSLEAMPTSLWPVMLANIVVVGGNAKFPGFVERLQTEIRQIAPAECIVRVAKGGEDPVKATWMAGATMASDPIILRKSQVTREEYLEHGSTWLDRVFQGKEGR